MSGLSKLQWRILALAVAVPHPTHADILERVFGWPTHCAELNRGTDGTLPVQGNHFSRAAVGAQRYRSNRVSLVRAVDRLVRRGLVTRAVCTQGLGSERWALRASAIAITEAGRLIICSREHCISRSDNDGATA